MKGKANPPFRPGDTVRVSDYGLKWYRNSGSILSIYNCFGIVIDVRTRHAIPMTSSDWLCEIFFPDGPPCTEDRVNWILCAAALEPLNETKT